MSMQRKYEHPTLKNVSSARKPTAATSTKRTAAMMYDQQQLLHRGVVPSSDGYMILNDRGDSDMGGDHHMSNKRNRYMQPQQQETLWRMVEPGRYEPVVRGGPIGHKMPMQYMPNGSVGPGLNAGMASQYDYYNVVADGEQDMMQNGYMMVPQQKHHPDLVGRAGIMPKNTSGVLKRSTKTIQRVTERPPNMSDAEWAVHQYANESDNAADEDYRQVRQDESTGPFQSGMRMMVPWAQPGSGASRKFPDGRVERTNSMPNLGSGGYGQGIPGRNNFGGPLPTRQWGNNGNEDIQGWGQPQQGVDRPYSLVVASGTPARGNNEPSKAQQGAKKRNEKVGPIALNEEEGSEGHQNAGYSDDASPRQQEYMPSGLTPTNGALAGFSPSSSNETFFNNPISPSSSALYGSALNFDEEGRGTGGNIFSFSPHRGGAMRASSQQQQMAYQQQQQQIYYPSSRGPFQYPTNRAQQQGGGGTRTGAKGRRGPYKRDDSETMAAAAAEEAHNKSTSEMMMTHAAGRGVGGGEGGSHVTFAPGVAQSPASAAYHRQRSFNRNASEDEAILLRRTISLSSDDWNRGLDETAEVVNTLASFGRTNSVVQGDQYDRQGQPSSAPYDDRDQEMDDLFEGHHSSLEPHPQHPTFSYGQAETA